MSTLNTLPYAKLQATDAVTGKIMLSDGPDRDAFARLKVSRPFTLFEGSTIYDSNPIFFDDDVRGSASITGPTNAAMTLTVTGTTPNDYAARQSHSYVHYQPGKSLLGLFSFCFGASVAGVVKRVGLYDVDNSNFNNPNNGVFLEQSASGLTWYVYQNNANSQSIAQANWNVDPLNGTGASGVTLDPLFNLLGFVDLEWLGVGKIRCGFYVNGVPIVCHVFSNTSFTVPYMNNPLLPVRYEIRRISGSLPGSFTAICCAVMSEGGYEPIGAVHALQSPRVSVNDAVIQSLVSIRLQSTSPRALLVPISVEIASDIGGNATAYFSMFLWRPSSAAAVPAGWSAVSSIAGGGGTGSIVEYNTSTTMYTTMVNDVTVNGAKCIKVDECAVSSVAKNTFQLLNKSLCVGQSAIDRTNRDVFVIVINNTTSNSRNFTALMTWREI